MRRLRKGAKEMTEHPKFNDYLLKKLRNRKYAEAFLNAAILEYEGDQDSEAFMLAIRLLAEAQGGIAQLSAKTKLNRQNLYKILTGKTTPRLDTVDTLLQGLGFRLTVTPLKAA
jgi:probable addiction module antidote protein